MVNFRAIFDKQGRIREVYLKGSGEVRAIRVWVLSDSRSMLPASSASTSR